MAVITGTGGHPHTVPWRGRRERRNVWLSWRCPKPSTTGRIWSHTVTGHFTPEQDLRCTCGKRLKEV